MRTLFLSLFVVLFSAVNAQTISGFVKDDAGTLLNGATVALVKAKDTAVVKLAVAGGNGAYSFNGIKEGDYRISISHVGYNSGLSSAFTLASGDVSAPAVTITKAAGDLKSVTVSVRKPIVEVRADKTILNVEGTVNAAGQDALELLRKAPGVTVDKDENLTVNGKNGVQIYVDGRPTPLSGADLANYLKSMQSSQVESIEIITNPSAKYEAAGNAGIINIRLKKNKSFGTNGSVNAGYAVGIFSKYNSGLNLNYRNKAINLYGTYSFSKGLSSNQISLYRTVKDTLFDQSGEFVSNNLNHNFKLGADYTLSKQSSIGVLVNGTVADPTTSNYSRTPISYIPTGVVDRILIANNSSNLKRNNYNLNLNYNYNGADGKTLVLNADNGYYNINSDQYQPNFYFTADGKTLTRSVIYRMIAPTVIHINSGKLDYEQNFKGGKLGLGGKISFINTDNNFQRYDVVSSTDMLDRDRSNRFKYKENINAGYVNWNKAYKGFMVQAGLRVENTVSKGTSDGQKKIAGSYQPSTSGFDRNYTGFFPSASVTFNKNPMNQLSLTYSRRIDRPAYQDLNPFEFKLDEYTFQKGNTELRPQYTNSIEITNVYKYRLTTKLNYSHVSDLFTQILDTAETSKSFISKKNLATQDIASFNISYPFQYKAYSVFANLNANYAMYKADFGAGRKIDLNTFGATLFAQNSLRFAKTWTAELTGFYNAPSVYQGTFEAKSLWSVDAGLQKQVLKGNGTIKASVSDIFHSLRFNATSDFAGQTTRVNARWEAQQFKLNFSLRFGSNTVKGAKQKALSAEEENKRAQQQGGGIGVGNN
jgi:hypothetical protein